MTELRAKILVVDDEEQNLVSFKASFRRNFNILTAISADEALQMVHENPDIKVVVSDHRMPVKTGVKFLEELKAIDSDIIRIVLTGYADLDATKDAINKADVYRYLNKPWNETDLLSTLNAAIEHFDTKKLLESKQKELENAYSELSRFVYSASHDLRAPLVSVIGLINLAKMDPAHNQDQVYMPLIEKSINKLDVFVRNIVDYYQNKERKEARSEININQVLDDALNALEYYRKEADVKFIKELTIESPIISDEFRIRVILNNLISNAVKYQKKEETDKKIFIRIFSDAVNVRILVEDNGIGIKDSALSNLFEMFYRATNEDSGSGIGLYIVKDAVTKLNGSIEVASEIGKGSVFTVHLPNQNKEDANISD